MEERNPHPSSLAAVTLPGYHAQPTDDGVAFSNGKLRQSQKELIAKFLDETTKIKLHPCQKEEETYGYRCTCCFQLIWNKSNSGDRLEYAMRSQNRPVRIGSDSFPIANQAIQWTMRELIVVLNDETCKTMTKNLTSVSFASSWESNSCVVTLHYGAPVDEVAWKVTVTERLFNQTAGKRLLIKVVGRSRKRVFEVVRDKQPALVDTIWYIPSSGGSSLQLRLGSVAPVGDTAAAARAIHYQKTETAFFHPNATAMMKALQWMMERVAVLTQDGRQPLNMLEIYCGIGAHTVALAETGFLSSILAIELDRRLVDACVENAKQNGCYASTAEDDHYEGPKKGKTPVQVVQGDAGAWARKLARQVRHGGEGKPIYHILLVDPPRMGLDDQVCQLALVGGFTDVIYISCGRHALLRDLEKLTSFGQHIVNGFEILDCQLLDLFPRTDSVETLLHMRRCRRHEEED